MLIAVAGLVLRLGYQHSDNRPEHGSTYPISQQSTEKALWFSTMMLTGLLIWKGRDGRVIVLGNRVFT